MGQLLLVTSTLVCAGEARAERAAVLMLGSELRTRAYERTVHTPRYELSIPHGISSASGRTTFAARVGVVVPSEGKSLAFPISMGLRYAPFDSVVRPLLGTDFGGYLTQGRGQAPADVPRGPEWCWSTRALAGLSTTLSRTLSLMVYVDAMWAQTPQDPRSREYVFSSLGLGVELRFSFAPPDLRILDMLIHGTAAPEGY
jgi:hypothetical protein